MGTTTMTLDELDRIRKKVSASWTQMRKLPKSGPRDAAMDANADAWGFLTRHMIKAGYKGRWGSGIEMIGRHARRTDKQNAYTRRRKVEGPTK
jgi:hypothetical protein